MQQVILFDAISIKFIQACQSKSCIAHIPEITAIFLSCIIGTADVRGCLALFWLAPILTKILYHPFAFCRS